MIVGLSKIKTQRGKLDLHDARAIWWRFARYARPELGTVIVAMLASLGAMFATLATPWPVKVIFDYLLMPHGGRHKSNTFLTRVVELAQSSPFGLLFWSCLAILLIALAEALFSHGRDVNLATAGTRLVGRIRRDLFAHLQTLPPSVFERRGSGELQTRLTGDVQMLRQMLVDTTVTVVQNGSTLIATVIALLWLSPTLALVGFATIPVVFWTGWRISRQIRNASKDQREKESAVADIAHDVIGAMSIIQAFNREAIEQKRFARNNRSSTRAGVKTTRLESRLYRVISIAAAASTCVILYLGVRFVMAKTISAGDLLVFMAYLRGMNRPMRQLGKTVGTLAKATTCGERVLEVFSWRPAIVDAPDAVPLAEVQGAVAFEHVTFGYQPDVPALVDISFRVEPGQRVAIVGHTGAGKSTLAKLLLRFYDPTDGCVRVDDRDVRTTTLASLRRCIGWAHQDAVLFGMSVRENIAFGSSETESDEAIHAVAQMVAADRFIEQWPSGYDTVLGQKGMTLSGGERQRLALARALFHKPRILLLDEPATGLDAVTRKQVEEAWLSSTNAATTIVICHRLREMERFSRILLLRQGRIAESGTHQELMELDGEYAAMWNAQGRNERTGDRAGQLAC